MLSTGQWIKESVYLLKHSCRGVTSEWTDRVLVSATEEWGHSLSPQFRLYHLTSVCCIFSIYKIHRLDWILSKVSNSRPGIRICGFAPIAQWFMWTLEKGLFFETGLKKLHYLLFRDMVQIKRDQLHEKKNIKNYNDNLLTGHFRKYWHKLKEN